MKTSIIYIILIIIALFGCGSDSSDTIKNSDRSMGDDPSTILKIISSDPSYRPTPVQELEAKAFLTKIYAEHKIESTLKDTIEFIDQGQNFDSILCPFCETSIETDDWQDEMEKAYQTNFTDLKIITKCCKKHTSLNDLKYVTTAGFAKFVLTVIDPETEMMENNLVILGKILETPLKLVYAHY